MWLGRVRCTRPAVTTADAQFGRRRPRFVNKKGAHWAPLEKILAIVLSARWPPARLPAVVREGLVGLRHAVDVVLALERVALLLLCVEQLVGKALRHRLLAPLTRELDQ